MPDESEASQSPLPDMTGRILASLFFVVGGIAAFYALGTLHGLGSAQAGMGAGAGSHSSSGDGLLAWPICLYFAISALGLALCRQQDTLGSVAAVAHVFLLLALLGVCAEGMGSSGGLFAGLLLSLGMLVLFSPWLSVWALILFRRKKS